MAGEMRSSPVFAAGASKSELNRQSDWTRHLNQSKSIRLRRTMATLAAGVSFGERERQVAATMRLIDLPPRSEMASPRSLIRRRQPDGDFGRVSINHVGGGVYGGEHRQATEAAVVGNASGIQNPMISSVTSKSSGRNGRQHLKTMGVGREIATSTATRKSARHRIPLSALFAVMVASIVCCANLIGHCNCDTNDNNPFSGYHRPAAAVGYKMTDDTGGPPRSTMTQSRTVESVEAREPQLSRRADRISTRDDKRPARASARKNQMDELIRSMAESVERQHLGLSGKSSFANIKPSKFDSTNPSGRRHEDILASHERGHQLSAKGTSNYYKQSIKPLPATSKADQELRQIMLMHEHAASTGKRKLTTQQQVEQHQADTIKETTGAKSAPWPSSMKLLSKLPKDLLKANLMSVVPEKVLKIVQSQGLAGKTAAQAAAADTGRLSSTTSTTTGSPFTPRANAKNYLMGPILGLGQMLMSQPRPTVDSRHPFSRYIGAGGSSSGGDALVAQSTSELPKYSQPANEFRPTGSRPKKSLQGEPNLSSVLPAEDFTNPDSWQALPSDDSAKTTKQKTGGPKKNGWLVDSATQLAQTYFKDSFRDLLTLSQLPIFSGGPVSTAPSDLEPGGKKWLADKQAAEQMRGNRTNALEELLRYVYILGNVGVRRKRDPLKALGSGGTGSHSHNALNSLAAATSNKRPLLAFLADRPITSLIKPPKATTGSKLSSFLRPNSDHIKSRGVMWDMATDPTLAVTMFHLLERASVALPLGFLLMPFVHMVRHPLGGLNLGRILPARASHRSVDLEELAKRLDMMDKILSRSMRSTHRDASLIG